MSEAKKPLPRGYYIPIKLAQYFLGGDSYIKVDDAYSICAEGRCSYKVFEGDMAEQFKRGTIRREGTRLYLTRTWKYENYAAEQLADILTDNTVSHLNLSENLDQAGEIVLNSSQCDAVRMGLTHRLSVILGGAGTGKTTLIKKMIDEYPTLGYVSCAPTGKAARNLAEKTGYDARTVHSALGLHPDDYALSPVIWEHVGLVIVDEAGMLTLELFAGLLCKVRRDCRIVLVGDPNQLQSVGSGNVFSDLLQLGIPCAKLQQNYRQKEQQDALYHNVLGFGAISEERQLQFDDSFYLNEVDEQTAEKALIEEAVRRYRDGESVQVLSPYNSKTKLSVNELNRSLQAHLNPPSKEKKELSQDTVTFRDGDRVIITKNDNFRHCSNGDVGIFHIKDTDEYDEPMYYVEFFDGRSAHWVGREGLSHMSLAYALTVHKSQGSQYDTILLPVIERFNGMLYRNILYTAISRAKKKVILYGCRSALSVAIQSVAPTRKSQLVPKTNMRLLRKPA